MRPIDFRYGPGRCVACQSIIPTEIDIDLPTGVASGELRSHFSTEMMMMVIQIAYFDRDSPLAVMIRSSGREHQRIIFLFEYGDQVRMTSVGHCGWARVSMIDVDTRLSAFAEDNYRSTSSPNRLNIRVALTRGMCERDPKVTREHAESREVNVTTCGSTSNTFGANSQQTRHSRLSFRSTSSCTTSFNEADGLDLIDKRESTTDTDVNWIDTRLDRMRDTRRCLSQRHKVIDCCF